MVQVSLADASLHEFPLHLRDHLVMESVTIARQNWLEQVQGAEEWSATLSRTVTGSAGCSSLTSPTPSSSTS